MTVRQEYASVRFPGSDRLWGRRASPRTVFPPGRPLEPHRIARENLPIKYIGSPPSTIGVARMRLDRKSSLGEQIGRDEKERAGRSRREKPPYGKTGAGEGNRTLVVSLGSFCSAIELHPQAVLSMGYRMLAGQKFKLSVADCVEIVLRV